MMPVQFLQLWAVLEIGIPDIKVASERGNRYLLVALDDRAFPL